jgi:hypothetical protein
MMKRSLLLLTVLLFAGVCFRAIEVVGDDSPDYTYDSDTERWYYIKESYERPYLTWMLYRQYYNATHYNLVQYPYYTTGYSYRRVKVYEYYLKVETDLPEASVTGEGWYKDGSSASISADRMVEAGGETKHHFSYWSGDFSGSSTSGTITIDRSKTVIANYKASHRLQVKSSPMDVLGFIEDSWYEEGETRVVQSAPEIINADQGERYVFVSWYVDRLKVAGNPISVEIDEPHIVEARYGTQYYLDVRSLYGASAGSGWYDAGAIASFEVTTPVEAGLGRKWVFQQWSGDAITASPQGTVAMDGAKTVTATWRLNSTMLYIIYGLILAGVIAAVAIPIILITRPGIGTRDAQPNKECQSCGYRLTRKFQYCPICGSKKTMRQRNTAKSR